MQVAKTQVDVLESQEDGTAKTAKSKAAKKKVSTKKAKAAVQ